tara:strand:- start:12351 stop:12497 length:147 start_codon:yes stop_codon:yes gene_type:complete
MGRGWGLVRELRDIGNGYWDTGVGRIKYKGYGYGVNLGIEVWDEQKVM